MRWAKHVAGMRGKRNAFRICLGNPKNREHAEDLGVDVRIILQ
jgi:hypothetical protein